MSGENEQIEEEKKADGGKIKIPAHLMQAKQAPVAKPAWMQRLASAKQVGGNRQQQAPEVTVNTDASNEDSGDVEPPSPPRRRTYKVKKIHTLPPTSTPTDGEIKETSDHALPPSPEPAKVAESTGYERPSMQSQLSKSPVSELVTKPMPLKEENQTQNRPAIDEHSLQSSGSSNQEPFEDKTDDGSSTVEEVISSDDDSGVELESASSGSSGDPPVEDNIPVGAATTPDPVTTTPQSAFVPVIAQSRKEPSSTRTEAAASREPAPSQLASSETPIAAPKTAASPASVPLATESPMVSWIPERPSPSDDLIPTRRSTAGDLIPRRPSGAIDDHDLVPGKSAPFAGKESSTYSPSAGGAMVLPRRPSMTSETEEPPSLLRATPTKTQEEAVNQGVINKVTNDRRYNRDNDSDDDDDDDNDSEGWMFPQRHEDDSSWVNPSHPIQPERKQHLTEELKKKSVDLFPENGHMSPRMVNLKSIDEESNMKDFDYDPKVGFIVDPHVRGGGDGQTISETSFSEVSKMDSSAKIIETAVPKKDMDVWAMPSQEGTYRALGKLDTHKDGKDYRFSYIAQPHTHSTASYADVVRERYFPKEDNEYWAAPAREAPPELPLHISREGTIKSGPGDENESWMPPEDDPNQPPVDKDKIYAPTLADEKYSEARSVVSEGSDWIGRGAMSTRVDFSGDVKEENVDAFEWNPPREPSDGTDGNPDEDDQTDESEEFDESEENDDEEAVTTASAPPRPPSPPAALQGKRASESAPKDKAAPASDAKYDYSSSGRLKFDLTPKMIMIEGNEAKKENTRSQGPGGSYPKDQARKRCYLFLFFFIIVLLGGVACIVIFVVDPFNKSDNASSAGPDSVPTMEPTSGGEDSPTKAPSPTATFFPGPAETPSTPTSSIAEEALVAFLSKISSDNGEALKDSTSPQYEAMQWLLSSANVGIYKDATLIQRYALATLYYATGGEQWLDSTSWLTEVSECEWYTSSATGSICDMDDNLLELNLMGNSLTGSLPPELDLLSNSLITLHLSDNKLSGQIPPELSALGRLETLQLSKNQFRGTIPTLIGTMSNLKTLFLLQNTIRSSIPTQLGQLSSLEEIDLGANRLTGAIPTEIGVLSDLTSLSLYGNDLTGTIPSQLAQLSKLRVLYLDGNDLGPFLPESICTNLSLDVFWSDCDEIGGCDCCTNCCQDGETCA